MNQWSHDMAKEAAAELYEKAGMHIQRQSDEYELVLRDGEDLSCDTPGSDLVGNWRVKSIGWVGGWPIPLDGTNVSMIFVFGVDAFTVTVRESSALLCETTGTYVTIGDILHLTPTGSTGSDCTSDFLVPAIAEYSISGEALTLTEVADDPVWYELEKMQ